MKHLITEIQIIPIKPQNGLVAFASCVIDNAFYISSLGIHSKLNGSGYRLTYPTKKIGATNINLFHPITKDLSKAIEEAVLNYFKNVMNKSHDRHYCSYPTT